MNTRKALLTICVMVIAIVAGLVISKHAVLLKAHAAAKSVALPYTATQEELWVGPHGDDRGRRTYTMARKGDGTTIVVDGKFWILKYGTENRTVQFTKDNNNITTMGTGEVRTLTQDEDCRRVPVNAERIGEDAILGHPAIHVRTDSSKTPGEVVVDQWNAKDLACLELQRVYTSNDGSRDIQRISSLTIGEPDEKLFQLPSNPHEVTPHEFFAAFHNPIDAKSKEHIQADERQEEHYRRDKALRGE